ncbi:MAG: FKBP-type peptidyl-prolyl cis-trans isomerase N-terminal domain-containing protein, partial [Bacteroidia bacterium]
MKNILILSMIVLTFSACTQNGIVVDTAKSTELATDLDSVSYLLGGDFAKNVSEGVGMTELDNKSFLHGMQRVFEGKELEISDADAKAFMQAYFGKLKEAKGASVKAEGMAFLEENIKKEGVQVTASGL